jgi:hypothetical protein
MANKPNFRQIIDSGTGVAFAVMVNDGGSVRTYGSMKQGRDWASWANDSRLSYEELISSLDPGLEVGPSMELTQENLSLVSDSITPSTMRELSGIVPVVVAVVRSKSEPEQVQQDNHPSDDEPEFELLENWPLKDVALSMFDVQLKKIALNFKAKSFLSKKDYASLVLKVKGSNAKFVDGKWTPRPTAMDDGVGRFGRPNRRLSMRLYSELDDKGYFEKMVPIGASRFNTNPMTARDADKDRLVLEGIPWINMGRGIPDPTPFGETGQNLQGIRSFGGKFSSIGKLSNRKVRRTRRALARSREAALRTVNDEMSWLSDGNGDPTASMAGRLRRRLADYIAEVGDAIGGEQEAAPKEEEVITRRQRRRRTDAETVNQAAARPRAETTEEPEIAERSREMVGETPITPPVVSSAEERLESAAETVSTEGTSPLSRRERGVAPRRDGDSMARRLSKRIGRLSKRINSTASPQPTNSLPSSQDVPTRKVRQLDERFLPGEQNSLNDLISVTQPYSTYDSAIASDRFASRQIPFSDYSPADQSAILSAASDAREQLQQTLEDVLRRTIYDEDGSVFRAPYLGPEEPFDAESVNRVLKNNDWINSSAEDLSPYNKNFYDSLRTLIALDDMLFDRWTNAARNRDEDFLRIDDAARGLIQRMANAGDRGFSTGRVQGATGERTVLRQALPESRAREIALSKIQPRKLLMANPNRATEEDGSPVKPFSSYTQNEQSAILAAANNLRKSIGSEFRTLGKLSPTDEMTEEMVDGAIVAADPDDQVRLLWSGHDAVILDDMLEDLTSNATRNRDGEWASLRRETRKQIIQDSNINAIPVVPKTTSATRPTRTPKSGQTTATTQAAPTPPTPPTMPSTPQAEELTETPTETTRSSLVDAANTMVSVTDEDGNVRQVPLGSLGRVNQYDFANVHLDKDGVPYVHENATRLYRNPVTGEYLEDYSQVEITVDKQIPPTAPLPQVQISKKAGAIVSYPQITLDSANSGKYSGLANLQSDRKTGPLTIGQILTEVLGLSSQDVQALLGKKFYLAPGVKPGASTNNWRQAALLLLATSNHEIPNSEKRQMQMIDVVDVPAGSDVTEAYLRYADRPELADEYVSLGRPNGYIDKEDDGSSGREKFAPPHLRNYMSSGYRRSSSMEVFKPEDESNRYRYMRQLAPGMRANSAPRAGKLLVLWRHPLNFEGYYYYGNSKTQAEQIVESVNKALMTDLPEDWYTAFNNVVAAYSSALSSASSALHTWRGLSGARSRNPRPKREFVMHSEMAEAMEKILVDIFRPNMFKVIDSIRRERQQQSRTMNAVGRIRRKASQSGIKNVGGLEDSQLFVPLDESGRTMEPRKAEDIMSLYETHRATGFLPEIPYDVRPDDPLVLEELSEDGITMLSGIALASEMSVNVVDSTRIGDNEEVGNSRKALEIASLHFSGGLGKPIQVTEEEYKSLAGSSQIEGSFSPNFFPIRRGIRSPKPGSTTHQMAQELISGPYYVPAGEGAAAGGYGLNFDSPGGHSGYSNGDPSGDITIGLLPRTARIMGRFQLETLKNQVEIMAEAFMTRVGYDSGTPRDLPIDTGLEGVEFDHLNPANVSYKADRPDTGYGYYAPWYGVSRNVRYVSGTGADAMSESAKQVWAMLTGNNVNDDMTISGGNIGIVPELADSSQEEALRTLAASILAAAMQNQEDSWRWNSDDPSDTLPASEWFKRTRAQVFGWFVQMEILKGMEIAKLKAEGKAPWNERIAELVRAQKVLLYNNDHVLMAALFNVDAYDSGGQIDVTTRNPDLIMKKLWETSRNAHMMIVNRTAIIMLRNPVTTGTQDEIVEGIFSTVTDSSRPGMVYNPYTEKWIPDPRLRG